MGLKREFYKFSDDNFLFLTEEDGGFRNSWFLLKVFLVVSSLCNCKSLATSYLVGTSANHKVLSFLDEVAACVILQGSLVYLRDAIVWNPSLFPFGILWCRLYSRCQKLIISREFFVSLQVHIILIKTCFFSVPICYKSLFLRFKSQCHKISKRLPEFFL